MFSYLDDDSKIFIASLLCGDSLYSLSSHASLNELGILSALSLSGFHLSFFLNIVRMFLKEKQLKYYTYFELIFISFFLFLSNFRYSIRRIFLSKLVFLITQKTRFKLPYLERVSLIALLFLLFEPYSILSGSFYYPFPLLFLLALFPSKRNNTIKGKVYFSLTIFAFYLPFRLFQNPSFHLLSPFFQLMIIPLSHLIFLLSLGLVLLPGIGYLLNIVIGLLLHVTDSISSITFSFNAGQPTLLFLLIYYGFFIIAMLLKTYHYPKQVPLAIVSLSLTFSTCFMPNVIPQYKVTFIDVGQGDCTLIQYRYKNLLIDTGGNTRTDIARDCLIPYFNKKKIDKLDAIIITHEDYDHYGALEALQASFKVDHVFYHQDFLNQEDHQVTFQGLTITDLNIYENDTTTKDNNTKSGVYYFTLKNESFLIMGDAPKEIEAKILQDNPTLDCDYIKLGHHGSNTSSSKDFLTKVSPKSAIISCGLNNSYGHPHKEVLNTLASLSIPCQRTDEVGSIVIRC